MLDDSPDDQNKKIINNDLKLMFMHKPYRIEKLSYKEVNKTLRYALKILEFYTCPESCHAHCCKVNQINFGQVEYNMILEKYPDLKHLMETSTNMNVENFRGQPWREYMFIETLCPLLKEDRCSVQAVKPFICRMYPFKTDTTAPPNYLGVDPCPIGTEITIDYDVYANNFMLERGKIPEEMMFLCMQTNLKYLMHVIEGSKSFATSEKSPKICIPLEDMPDFYRYLKKTPAKVLAKKREEIKALNKDTLHDSAQIYQFC